MNAIHWKMRRFSAENRLWACFTENFLKRDNFPIKFWQNPREILHPHSYCFPFGRPEGQLKATLTLLERVLMKDVVSPTPSSEVRSYVSLSAFAALTLQSYEKQPPLKNIAPSWKPNTLSFLSSNRSKNVLNQPLWLIIRLSRSKQR